MAFDSIQEITRVCRRCGEDRPITEFYPHPKGRDGRRGHCSKCSVAEVTAQRIKNPTPHNEANRRYHSRVMEDPARREQYLAKRREAQRLRRLDPEVRKRTNNWRRENVDKVRPMEKKSQLLTKYGLTMEAFKAMLAAQNGQCAICLREILIWADGKISRTACVDHDHETNAVRALLCGSCNSGVGHFGDDPKTIDAAAAYLRKHGK
jgi:Recombination endonuclease VII